MIDMMDLGNKVTLSVRASVMDEAGDIVYACVSNRPWGQAYEPISYQVLLRVMWVILVKDELQEEIRDERQPD